MTAAGVDVFRRIQHFKSLKQDWDGNDALPPETALIDHVLDVVAELDDCGLPLFFAAPGPNGEMLLELKQGESSAELFYNEDQTEELILYRGKEQTYSGAIDQRILINHFSVE